MSDRVEIRWARDGDGWVGRWWFVGIYGESHEFEVAPEGGLHGGWKWRNPHCIGIHHDEDEAKLRCELSYTAVEEHHVRKRKTAEVSNGVCSVRGGADLKPWERSR